MSKLYKIEAIVPARPVGSIMELMEGECGVINVQPCEEFKEKRKPATKRKPRAGQSAAEFIIQLLETRGSLSPTQLAEEFIRDGRAAGSVSSALSYLTRDGRAVRNDKGLVILPTKPFVPTSVTTKIA